MNPSVSSASLSQIPMASAFSSLISTASMSPDTDGKRVLLPDIDRLLVPDTDGKRVLLPDIERLFVLDIDIMG